MPLIKTCADIEDRIHDGITDELGKAMQVLQDHADVTVEVEKQVGKILEPGDLAEGRSPADIRSAGGAGFLLNSPAYVRTGNLGGDVFASEDGVYLAAGVLAYDKGGDRFQYTVRPHAAPATGVGDVAGLADGGRDYDIGSSYGASVNQLAAVTAGGRPRHRSAQNSPAGRSGERRRRSARSGRDVDVDGNGTADVTVAVRSVGRCRCTCR